MTGESFSSEDLLPNIWFVYPCTGHVCENPDDFTLSLLSTHRSMPGQVLYDCAKWEQSVVNGVLHSAVAGHPLATMQVGR